MPEGPAPGPRTDRSWALAPAQSRTSKSGPAMRAGMSDLESRRAPDSHVTRLVGRLPSRDETARPWTCHRTASLRLSALQFAALKRSAWHSPELRAPVSSAHSMRGCEARGLARAQLARSLDHVACHQWILTSSRLPFRRSRLPPGNGSATLLGSVG